MQDWIELCGLEDLPVEGARVVKRARKADLAVFRTVDDRVFAVLDRCPHRGGPLSQGIVHGHRVTCPLHAWNIDLATGEAVAPDRGCAKRFPVKVEDGRVWIDAAALRAPDDASLQAVAP